MIRVTWLETGSELPCFMLALYSCEQWYKSPGPWKRPFLISQTFRIEDVRGTYEWHLSIRPYELVYLETRGGYFCQRTRAIAPVTGCHYGGVLCTNPRDFQMLP